MVLFGVPSFFAILVVVVLVAAVLGLTGRPLAPWGMASSLVLLVLLLWGHPDQAVALAVFLVLSLGMARWLMARPQSQPRFYASVALACAPPVSYTHLTLPTNSRV